MDKEYDPTDYVYPACLPESSFDKFEEIRANVSGWGSLDGEATVSSVTKKSFTMPWIILIAFLNYVDT